MTSGLVQNMTMGGGGGGGGGGGLGPLVYNGFKMQLPCPKGCRWYKSDQCDQTDLLGTV